jgi:hypothetical protein
LWTLLLACSPDPDALVPADTVDWSAEIDGMAGAPPGAIGLTVGAVAPTEPATFTATGLSPGDAVVFVVGLDGHGPDLCPAGIGGACFDVAARAYRIGRAVADITGTATLVWTPRVTFVPGLTLTAQAVYPDPVSPVFTPAVDVVIGESACPTMGEAGAPAFCPAACTGGCDGGTCRIACDGTSECQVTTLTCPDGMNCEVSCTGLSACQVSTVFCPDGGYCAIYCAFTSTCQFLDIYGGDGAVDLRCSGLSACQAGELWCGDGPCMSVCDGVSSSLGAEHCAASCDCDLGC